MKPSSTKKSKARFWLCIALVLCLISCIGASAVQTSFGQVTIRDLRFETASGHQMSALLLIPDTATPETPAPAIVCSHGWYNNREMQDLNYVEYARRGFVVLSIDMYGHGNSENLPNGTWWEPENNANGMYDAVQMMATLPFVDASRIGVTGHSNGALASRTAVLLDNEAETPADRRRAAGLQRRRLHRRQRQLLQHVRQPGRRHRRLPVRRVLPPCQAGGRQPQRPAGLHPPGHGPVLPLLRPGPHRPGGARQLPDVHPGRRRPGGHPRHLQPRHHPSLGPLLQGRRRLQRRVL